MYSSRIIDMFFSYNLISPSGASDPDPAKPWKPSAKRDESAGYAGAEAGRPLRQSADGSQCQGAVRRTSSGHQPALQSLHLPIEFSVEWILNRRAGQLDRPQSLWEMVKWLRFLVWSGAAQQPSGCQPTRAPLFQVQAREHGSTPKAPFLQRRDDGADLKASLAHITKLSPDAPQHPPAEQLRTPAERSLPP